MICRQCGHEIPDGNKFCGNCGLTVESVGLSVPYKAGSFRTLFWLFAASEIIYFVFYLLSSMAKLEVEKMPQVNPLLMTGESLFCIATLYFGCQLLYRCWKIIQDGENVKTTPGKAVAYYFIPVFNCYWAFVAQVGLAKGLNDYCSRRNLTIPHEDIGVYLMFEPPPEPSARVNETLAYLSSSMILVFTIFMLYGISHFSVSENLAEAKRTFFYYAAGVQFVNVILLLFLYDAFSRCAEAVLFIVQTIKEVTKPPRSLRLK